MDEQGVRINKYLSEAGVCSRREADRQIEAAEAMGNPGSQRHHEPLRDGLELLFQPPCVPGIRQAKGLGA